MSRRSFRLESKGYYDSEGEPNISYRETSYRIFRRRSRSRSPGDSNGNGYSNSNRKDNSNETSNSNANDNSYKTSNSNKTSNANDNSYKTSNSKKNSNANDNSYKTSNSNKTSNANDNSYKTSNSKKNSNANDNSYKTSNSNGNDNNIKTSNETSNRNTKRNSNRNDNMDSNNRGPRMSKLKIFDFPLFITLPLCVGFAYLIPSLSNNLLDSFAIPTMGLNAGFEDMAEHTRELQDELLKLKKKMNYLLPLADTLPNFALDSLGASVVLKLSSRTYQTQKAGETFFGIPIWRPVVSPTSVIQGRSPLVPGCCWAFAGGRGHLVIALSHPVAISHVTLGHISNNLSPTGTISSAPKEFSVYGLETLDDDGSQLATFLYDQDGDSVQTFKLPDHKKGVFSYVKLQVESNGGHPDFTCLYSFKVHGELAD